MKINNISCGKLRHLREWSAVQVTEISQQVGALLPAIESEVHVDIGFSSGGEETEPADASRGTC